MNLRYSFFFLFVCFVLCSLVFKHKILTMVLPKISKLSKSELQSLCEDRDIDSTDMDREQMMAELWKHEEYC